MIVEELWSELDEAALERFSTALAGDDLAGALFALEGASPEAIAEGREQLRSWGEAVSRAVEAPGGPAEQLEALRVVLVDEADLRGARQAYDTPGNSRLGDVLRRRRGLPILVSAIWIEVGRQAGIRVEGIGLPGHFIVRVGGKGGLYSDPYSGGVALTETQCRAIVRRISGEANPEWHPAFLEPRPLRQILERVINNLVRSHESRNELAALYRILAFLETLRPDVPAPLAQRAAVAERLGAVELARADYGRLLARFPRTPEARTAREKHEALKGRLLH